MKKITFLVILLSLTLTNISQTLPNYSFEEWTSNPFPPFEEPDSWNTPNPLTSLAQVVVVEKSNDAYSGNYSAKLTTRTIEVGNLIYTAPGLVTYAEFNVNPETLEYSFSGGLYMPERIGSLSGMYKYQGVDNDSAIAFIYTFRHPEGEETDTIGFGTTFLKDSDGWSPFTVNMVYFNNNQPDTFNVLLMSTSTFNIELMPVGSQLLVDSLTVKTSTGIFDLNVKNIVLNVFPNPATDRIVFETTKPEKERKLNIFNISGQLIKQVDFDQKRLQVNLNGLPAGNYSYRVFAGHQLYNSGKFIIK